MMAEVYGGGLADLLSGLVGCEVPILALAGETGAPQRSRLVR